MSESSSVSTLVNVGWVRMFVVMVPPTRFCYSELMTVSRLPPEPYGALK